jgi:hypothetical protein
MGADLSALVGDATSTIEEVGQPIPTDQSRGRRNA